MPYFDVDVGYRLAGLNVDNLSIDDEVDARLSLADIAAGVFTGDI